MLPTYNANRSQRFLFLLYSAYIFSFRKKLQYSRSPLCSLSGNRALILCSTFLSFPIVPALLFPPRFYFPTVSSLFPCLSERTGKFVASYYYGIKMKWSSALYFRAQARRALRYFRNFHVKEDVLRCEQASPLYIRVVQSNNSDLKARVT